MVEKDNYIQDSYSVIKYLTTDNKKWFNMTPFEVILFIVGMVAMITLPFVLKANVAGYDFGNPFDKNAYNPAAYNWWDVIFTIAPIFGISGAMMLTTKSKHSWIPLTIEAVMYGMYTFFALGSYALGSINMFIAPIILMFSQWNWRRHAKEGHEIETRKLNVQEGIYTTVGIFIVATGLGSIFIFGDPNGDPTNWLSWIDGLMGSVMLFGYLASALRYRETWYIFFASNVIKIISWTIAIAQAPDMGTVAAYSTSLTLAIVYFINASFGLIIWQKGKKEKLSEIKKEI